MPVPGSSVEDVISAAEQAMRSASRYTRGVKYVGRNFQNYAELTGRALGAAATTGGGTAEIQAGEAAGEALFGSFAVMAILVIVATLLILRIMEGWIIKVASWIPTFGIGSAQGVVKAGFAWTDELENWAAEQLYDAIKHTMHQMGIVVFFLIGIDPSTIAALISGQNMPSGIATRGQVIALQAQVNLLKQEYRELKYGTGAIPHDMSTPLTPDAIYIKVEKQYQRIEAQITRLHLDVQDFNKRLSHVEYKVDTANKDVQTVISEVHQVRAVAVGWQEVQEQVSSLGTTMDDFINTTTVELQANHRTLVALSPLTLLLQPGIRGLKNLRTLEDKMCQCPALPNIPSLMPERLALYEFMTNG